MRLGRQYGLSAAQKTEIWRRWKAGESLHEIGRALGKDHGSIHFLLSQHGGNLPIMRLCGRSGSAETRERSSISTIAPFSCFKRAARLSCKTGL
jgi:hypothetical protein